MTTITIPLDVKVIAQGLPRPLGPWNRRVEAVIGQAIAEGIVATGGPTPQQTRALARAVELAGETVLAHTKALLEGQLQAVQPPDGFVSALGIQDRYNPRQQRFVLVEGGGNYRPITGWVGYRVLESPPRIEIFAEPIPTVDPREHHYRCAACGGDFVSYNDAEARAEFASNFARHRIENAEECCDLCWKKLAPGLPS